MPTNQQISAALYTLFSREVEILAHQTGWIRRDPKKLTGLVWLQTWVLGFLEKPDASLEFLAQVARDLQVRVTRQGLQERLTPAVVPFMQAVLERAQGLLQNQVPLPLSVLTQFTRVQILDSTTLALPDALAERFPAAGGDGPKAGLKWHVVWEFLRGNLEAVFQTSARHADQSLTAHREYLVAGGLFLADLGYFVLGSLEVIVAVGGFFISRYEAHHARVYDTPDAPHPVDLLAWLQASDASRLERAVWLGQTQRLACRFLAVRLPEAIVEQRRRRARKTAQRKGYAFTAQHAAWLAWSVYVTNVPATRLPFSQVVLLYTLRWQIELLFKLWKSEGQIDRIAGTHEERVLCELYAKLIGLVIFHYLTAPVRWAERELSLPKALQTFRRVLPRFRHALSTPQTPEQLENTLAELQDRWNTYALKDKRRTRLSTCRLIELAALETLFAQEAPAPVAHCV